MTVIAPVDPPGLAHSPAFAQAMITPALPTVYVGGQNGIDGQGTMADGVAAQTAQAMRNLLAVLGAAGSAPEHVAKLTIHIADGADLREAFAASQSAWGEHRTAVTVLRVAGFARPDALVEIDAVAVVPGS